MIEIYTSLDKHVSGKEIKSVKLTLVVDAFGEEYVLIDDSMDEKALYKLNHMGNIIRMNNNVECKKMGQAI